MRSLFRTLVPLVLAAASVACGPGFTAATPPEFVEIENEWDPYDYRAATADGLVIAVREIEHDPQGKPAFWTQAIKNRIRDRGGYALLDEKEVKTAQGLPGTQLRFGHDEEGQPHLYVLTLFVTEDSLYVVEAGGRKELVEKHADQLDWAVQNFYVR